MARSRHQKWGRLALVGALVATMGMLIPAAQADEDGLQPVFTDASTIPPGSLRWVGSPTPEMDAVSHKFESLANAHPDVFSGLAFTQDYQQLEVYHVASKSAQVQDLVAGLGVPSSSYELFPRTYSSNQLIQMSTDVVGAAQGMGLKVTHSSGNFMLDGVVLALLEEPSDALFARAARELGPMGVVAFILDPVQPDTYEKPGTDVYVTEGTHHVNGREWRTTCESYSQTERCRTEIKAHVVTIVDGQYVKTYDWAFNNLTYAASPHALWVGNPLAGVKGGMWRADDGRSWKVDCYGDLGNACRAYAWVSYVEAYEREAGLRYRPAQGWVMNNIVRFSDARPAPDGTGIDLYS